MALPTRFIIVRGKDETNALAEASVKLGVPRSDLQSEQFGLNQYKITVLRGPAEFLVHISPDRFRCVLRRVTKPVGEGYAISVEECLAQLRKRGVIYGINRSVVEKIVQQTLSTPDYQMTVDFNEVIAEGKPPIDGEPPKLKEYFNMLLAEGDGAKEACVAGEVLAEIVAARPGIEGIDICGNKVSPHSVDSLGFEPGDFTKEEVAAEGSKRLVATAYGIIQRRGRKLSVVPQTVVEVDGSQATIDIYPHTFSKRPVSYDDLVQGLQAEGVVHGFLPKAEILPIIQKTQAMNQITPDVVLAVMTPPRHGTKQKVYSTYTQFDPKDPLDKARAEAGVVIPGQVILTLRYPEGKADGTNIFGKRIRARDGEVVELFPGKHVKRSTKGDETLLVSDTYGKVEISNDRVQVNSLVHVSADAMLVTMDLYPVKGLEAKQIVYALKEAEVMDGILEADIATMLAAGARERRAIMSAVVARGTPIREGVSAKLRFYFDRVAANPTGRHRGKRGPICRPGETLLEKVPVKHAEDGKTVYREKIPVPQEKEAKDVQVTAGEFVERRNEAGVQRYLATSYGYINWENNELRVELPITVTPDESEAFIDVYPKSDQGNSINRQIINAALNDFGIRTGVLDAELEEALKKPEPTMGVVAARATPAERGADAKYRFYFKVNGLEPKELLDGRRDNEPRQSLDFFLDGEVLAKKIPAEAGKDGKTVLGRKVSAERGRDASIQRGDNIGRSDDLQQITSGCKGGGYADVRGGKLTIIPLFRISDDRMKVEMDLYPAHDPSRALTKSKLMKALELAGIHYGIKEVEMHHALHRVAAESKPVLNLVIAEGTPPQNGKDGSLNIVLDMNEKVGQEREDKSMNYREEQ